MAGASSWNLTTPGCPPDDALRDLARGDTGVSADLSRHLESCDRCVARIASLVEAPPAARAPRLLPGARLGRYRIVEQIGEGGMAEVYEAIDTELERGVALKVVRSDLARDVLEQRLRRESKLMARARHPSVITVYDVGFADGEVYVAMELIRGGTLRDWLENGPRPLREIIDVYRRAGDGLAAAHRAGLVHRDFKPDNVLVESAGGRVQRVLVTDFGVARAMYGAHEPAARGRPPTVEATAVGALIGTPAYMAPEQLDGSEVDTRADVFAFAASIWEAVYGSRPFPGLLVAEIVVAMQSPPVMKPSHAMTTDPVPPELERTLRAALAIRREERTQTVGEVVAGLVLPGPKRRRWGRIAALASIPVALVVAGLVARVATGDDPCDAPLRLETLTAAAERATWARPLTAWSGVGQYPARWSALRGTACAADHAKAGPALACLAAERAWTIVTLDGLTAASDDDRRAALGELLPPSAPAECLTPAAGVLVEQPPSGADASRRAGALVVALARVSDLITRGLLDVDPKGTSPTLDRAQAELVALAPEVDAAHSPILTARRDVLAAMLADARSTFDGGVPHGGARDVAIRLYAGGQPREAARAWVGHLQRLAGLNLTTRVLDLIPAAEQSLHAAGDPPQLVAMWSTIRAIAQAYTGDFDAAQASLAAADELRASGVASSLDGIALRCQALEEAGQLDDAVVCGRDAVAVTTEVAGVGSSRVAVMTIDLARRLAHTDHGDDAITLLLALRGTRAPSTSRLDARIICELLVAYTGYERYADGAALYAANRQLMSDLGDSVCVSAAAEAYRALGNTDESYAVAMVAYNLDLAQLVANIYVRISFADSALDAGRAAEADIAVRGILAMFEMGDAEDIPPVLELYTRAVHGRALARLGRARRAEAIEELERAVATPGEDETPRDTEQLAPARARAALVLATLLPAADRARARALVTDALAVLGESPVEWRKDLAAGNAWLATHP